MSDSDPLFFILCIVAAVLVLIAGYYVLRRMKGSLKMELAQKSVISGDKIYGTLTLATKKRIQADRLYVALIGEREQRTTRRSSGGSSTSRKWVEFYRDEADIVMDEQFRAGFKETYGFELDTPTEATVMSSAQALSKLSDSMDEGFGKTLIKGLGTLSSMARLSGRKRWKVYARLETKGVDLAASSKIHVSLNQT